MGLRGEPVPRLLRRHPHHDDGARAARGRPGGRRAGGAAPALLDAVSEPADGGAGGADRGPVGHPRSPGVLHHLGHRGERHGAAPRDRPPPFQPGAGDAQRLPRAVLLHGRHHGQLRLVADQSVARAHAVRARRGADARAVRRPAGRRVHRRVRRGPAGRPGADPRRGGGADRRAGAGGRGFHLGPRRAVRGVPRRARRGGHPVDQRRGADGLGPYGRSLLGLAGACRQRPAGPADVRQGDRQRHVDRRRRGAGGGDELPGQQLDFHVRRQPRHDGRRSGQPGVPAGARPAGQRQAGGRAC